MSLNIYKLYFFLLKHFPELITKYMAYSRWIEYAETIKYLCLRDGLRILDIGSGGFGILPLYLGKRWNCSIWATDCWSEVLDSLTKRRNRIVNKRSNIIIKKEDVTNLSFPPSYFDRVTAISTIEHIPENGDIKAIKEIYRVLKNDGIAVISVPFNALESSIIKSARICYGKDYFYERVYDSIALKSRLLAASNFKVDNIIYFYERNISFEGLQNKFAKPIPKIFKPAKVALYIIMPLFAKLFWGLRDQNRYKSKKGKAAGRGGGAIIVLRK